MLVTQISLPCRLHDNLGTTENKLTKTLRYGALSFILWVCATLVSIKQGQGNQNILENWGFRELKCVCKSTQIMILKAKIWSNCMKNAKCSRELQNLYHPNLKGVMRAKKASKTKQKTKTWFQLSVEEIEKDHQSWTQQYTSNVSEIFLGKTHF